jgi:hypothetical protein
MAGIRAADLAHPATKTLSDTALAGFAQRRADGVLNPAEQSSREEILSGLLADKDGAAQISTAMRENHRERPIAVGHVQSCN